MPMVQANQNSIAGQIAAKNATKKATAMTSSEVTKENPNISANARLKQSGVGGAMKKGSYVLDNSAAGKPDTDAPMWQGTSADFGVRKNLTPGTQMQASAANPSATVKPISAGKIGATSPVAGVNTPSIPGASGRTTTGLPLNTPSGSTAGSTMGLTPGIPNTTTPQGLQGADLQLYNQLSPAQQAVFQKIGEEAKAKNEDVVKKQLEYIASVQSNKDYLTKSNDIAQRANTLQENNANIAASQNIAKAQAQIDSLKQMSSYLGSKGQPGKSMVGLDAVSKQIDTAQRLFNQIVSSENNATEARSLGREQDALNFEHQIQQLTTQLHTNVNQAILDAQQKLGADDITAKIGDPDEMQKLISDVMSNLDGDIAGMTNVHLEQMQYLIDQTAKIQESMVEKKKADNTVNEKLSEAYGYYMNENGNPVIGANGNPIPYQGKPLFSGLDQSSGNFVMVTKDQNGAIKVQSVAAVTPDQAKWQSDGLGGFFRTRPDGTLETMGAGTGGNMGSNSNPMGDISAKGADLFQKMRASSNPIGVYATGDMDGSRSLSFYNTSVAKGWENYLKSFEGTPITAEMVETASNQYGIDPNMIVATMAFDSSMGTKGVAVRTMNPGNVGNTGSSERSYPSWQEGVNAVARNLAQRQNALGYGSQVNTPTEFTAEQKNVMNGMLNKPTPDSTDAKLLAQSGLTTQDLANYKAQRNEGKWQENLTEDEVKWVNGQADKFYASKTAANFNVLQEAYDFARSIENGDASTDNQALIYAFAKAMDPNSVVRDSEYETVQKYAQTWGEKLGMNINRALNGQEFISDEAKKNMVDTIKSKYESGKNQYERERETYVKRIDDYTSKDVGNRVVPSNVMSQDPVILPTTDSQGVGSVQQLPPPKPGAGRRTPTQK